MHLHYEIVREYDRNNHNMIISLSGRMDTGSVYQSTEDVLGIVRVDISGTSGLVADEGQ